ncbi:OmpA family protein [Aquimarina pacifica]|uniref:OmpA family protein n=1 Tax=Aquimarina pacifica TaxID=1296415 RepID=UPI00046FC54C|nr:OmpA family protein [Aquimarina pacifica]
MKRGIFTILVLIIFTNIQTAEAQFFNKIKDKINSKINQEVDKTIDNTADDILNKTKKKKKKKEKDTAVIGSKNEPETDSRKKEEIVDSKNETSSILWNKYDFFSADHIFFYDDLKFEEYGEFPSKWDLAFGNSEIAKLNTEKIIQFKTAHYGTAIFPLITKKDYIDGYTTIEFDVYFDEQFYKNIHQSWQIGFHDISEKSSIYYETYLDGDGIEKRANNDGGKVDIQFSNGIIKVAMGAKYSGSISRDKLSTPVGWHHVALAFKNNNFKLYIDEHKLLNIPQLKFNPSQFYLYSKGKDDAKMTIKNIKFAQGGGSVYQRISTDGRYVTNGILFDSGKANIQPQSSGIIKKLADMMTDHPEWNFTIIGHTDSDGDTSSNLALSQQRAEAVRKELVARGINKKRLTTEGKGENQPLNKNISPIEKANNRRVEFVRS